MRQSRYLEVVAFFAGGTEEAGEKGLLDEGEGSGKSMGSVKAADFSFDARWFTESREELV